MEFFVVNYDYGTGSTYFGILAESATQIEAELEFVTVVDPLVEKGLTEEWLRRLKAGALPLSDPRWDRLRR